MKKKNKSLVIFLMVIAVEMTMVIKMLSFLKHLLSVRQETWCFTNFNLFKAAKNCFRWKNSCFTNKESKDNNCQATVSPKL